MMRIAPETAMVRSGPSDGLARDLALKVRSQGLPSRRERSSRDEAPGPGVTRVTEAGAQGVQQEVVHVGESSPQGELGRLDHQAQPQPCDQAAPDTDTATRQQRREDAERHESDDVPA